MVEKVKDETLAKLSKRILDEENKTLAPTNNNTKLNCWACGEYGETAEQCYACNNCSLWTLKKIFLHNRRFLRQLELRQLHRIGLTA